VKSIASGLAADLAAEIAPLATCLQITQKNSTVVGFTDHDQDLVIDGVTYHTVAGYTRSDIATSADLNVDNTEVTGPQVIPAPIEADVLAGQWDFAQYRMFRVNWQDVTRGQDKLRSGWFGPISLGRGDVKTGLDGLMRAYSRVIGRIVSPSCDANLGDARCKVRLNPPVWQPDTAYSLATGQRDATVGSIVSPSTPNGFVFWCGTPGTSGATEPTWTLISGGVTTDGTAVWESLPAPTVTGTITGVNADRVTLYDSGRTEAGPAGGYAISGITNANPAVVTLATTPDPELTDLQIVSISGVEGMDPVNAVTVVHNPSGTTFELDVDTSDIAAYPPYTGGGTVTPMGGEAGAFDNGTITFTSGLNNGLTQDIAYYDVGVFTLFLPMPYAVAAGDTYIATVGCDKSMETCRDRFFNIYNFRGSPYLPGIDKIVQVGRRNG
jgi:hypothetical protein